MYDSMMKPAFVFDGRLLLDHNQLQKIGFTVSCVGKKLDISATTLDGTQSAPPIPFEWVTLEPVALDQSLLLSTHILC